MIVKEWRDARWKFAVATALVLLAVLVSPIPTPYGELSSYAPFGRVHEFAAAEMWGTFGVGGLLVLAVLAAFLGVALVSGEVGGGSVFLLLSKPVSRTRLVLEKYAVCAGVLLAAAVCGAVLVVLVAFARGYPVGRLVSVPGVALSVLLVWLGALSVLGVALLASVLFRSVISSVVAVVVALFVIAVFPEALNALVSGVQWTMGVANCGDYGNLYMPCGIPYELLDDLRLYAYWSSEGLYTGKSLAPVNFLVSALSAALPLAGSLWLFDRKVY